VGEEAGLTMARRSGCGVIAAVCAAFCAALAPVPGRANDRPFVMTSNAAAEEDDDQVWSVETAWQRAGSDHIFSVAPEYAFNPTTSIQFDFSRGSERARGLEVEFKHLFNHIARDGWGWGIQLSLATGRDGDDSAWRRQSVSVKLPYTLQLREGDALLHLNAGLQKPREERREWIASAAFEHRLPARNTAFVEVGREDRQTLWHAGVRHWIRRDKLAVDFSLQQLRAHGDKASGAVFGVAWYDL
jgi:hypothetical protein